MGVSASGKSTIGRLLAKRLDCPFEEGDDLHPAANVAKMRAGHALDDADRGPWLDRVAAWIAERAAQHASGVISCSALKRTYRDRLRQAFPDLAFVLPDPDEATLRERIRSRTGHFMPPSLLTSQLQTLERPDASERALRIDGKESAEVACDRVLRWLEGSTPADDRADPA
ncbi:MAG: gluconokinase [Gammaproteobacteria bacterium]|nr:gluconokinase [Gammaproteobacteria bacterium]MBU1439797.1 gluconokinase [Gammaproteobacteria bacterium]MBU2288416.1 gluconokinase [Gammaproteobacteria bacterium]